MFKVTGKYLVKRTCPADFIDGTVHTFYDLSDTLIRVPPYNNDGLVKNTNKEMKKIISGIRKVSIEEYLRL